MSYAGRPVYTDDVTLRVYLRHPGPTLPEGIEFENITERYISADGCYTVGDISLAALRANKAILDDQSVFLCNIPRFFLDLD